MSHTPDSPVHRDASEPAGARSAPGGEPDAAALRELESFARALARLDAAGRAIPRSGDFRPLHAETLIVTQMARDALPAADRVLAQAPSQPALLEVLAAVYVMNDAHGRAVAVYRLLAAATPDDARARYNLATSLMFTSDLAGAAREIEACLARQPTFWAAYTVRAQLQRHGPPPPSEAVDALQALLKIHRDQVPARQHLNMALASAYERRGDYARAFAHLVEGNAASRLLRPYDPRQDAALFDALIQHAPAPPPAGAGHATDEPIFVFGLPRSGTTLVERILSSHPQVSAAGELKQFGLLLKYMSGSRTPHLLDVDTVTRARALDWQALGERYLAATRPLTGQAPRFVDKFPHHFLYAAHLANALPRARMICLRRDPMDTCLGNFREVFSEASPFHGYASDLLDTGRYYVQFDRLMAHWRRALPGRILEVSYEALVRDPEATVRAMLDFCDLPWDPACLAIEYNRAPVATASAVQVRAPLNTHAVGRWTHYAAQLAPLKNLLTEAGTAVGLSGAPPDVDPGRLGCQAQHSEEDDGDAGLGSPADALRLFRDVQAQLQAAIQASAAVTDFHALHGQALAVAQRARDALPAADRVLAQAPQDPDTLELLAGVYRHTNAQPRLAQVCRRIVSAQPDDARAHFRLATALMYSGDLAGAAQAIERCLQHQPTFWEAYTVLYTVLFQVRPHEDTTDRIARLQALLDRHAGDSHARERLNMALARDHEHRGDYARAFAHFSEGNAAGRTRRPYDARQDAALFDAVMQHMPTPQPAGAGHATDEPIFVFGLPRSGTTLVERMLSSHPQLQSAGELNQFGMLLKYLSGSPTPPLIDVDTVMRSREMDWRELGRRYLASTRPLTGQAPRFIDKFPHHFLYAAHLANALPRARMICVRRNPLDTCLGNFRQVFSDLSPFHGHTFDLLDTGRYYVQFERLMAHWRRALPGRILEVSYEALLQDPEATLRAMLAFCDLPWDPACLAFEHNAAPATTASAAQVRAPLDREAAGRWNHYATQLAPLSHLLVEAGIELPAP